MLFIKMLAVTVAVRHEAGTGANTFFGENLIGSTFFS